MSDSPYARDDTAKACAYANDLDRPVLVNRKVSELEGASRGGVLGRGLAWHIIDDASLRSLEGCIYTCE